MSEPLAVIFDMDGVLVDTYRAHYQSWMEMAQVEGLYFTEAEFAPTFGRTSREIIAHFWRERQFSDAQIAELDCCKEAAFRRIVESDLPAMPGVHQVLTTLHDEEIRLAVGSSGPPENVALVLEKLQAKPLFQAVVTGADVTRGKPDPEVFLLAAKRLDVPPAKCIVVEDAPAGVAAARAAGMGCIGLLSTGRTRRDLINASLLVPSLNEITPELVRLLIEWGV